MTDLRVEWDWAQTSETLNLAELARVCGMSAVELDELVEYGALTPLNSDEKSWLFTADCIPPLRCAANLRRDYDLDLFTVVILMDYLHRIKGLEDQVRSLQAERPLESRFD